MFGVNVYPVENRFATLEHTERVYVTRYGREAVLRYRISGLPVRRLFVDVKTTVYKDETRRGAKAIHDFVTRVPQTVYKVVR